MNSTHKPFVGPAVKVAVSMSMLVITSDLFAWWDIAAAWPRTSA